MQEQLYRLRTETKEAYDDAKSQEARFREIEKEQRDLFQVCSFFINFCIELNLIITQKFSQQFLLMRLRHATTDQDDISEALATNFVQSSAAANNGSSEANGKEVDDFVKEYRELRKTFHKRVIWGDRWAGRKVDWRD